ncbi:hypothetical protein [Dactylosporangium salmoneum]|uniref:Uncharacterized protein n=1 Tax=Dactylosporangium salmoneum TaxID=53361 RepID=A0ABN3G9L4_9ACTN
MSHAIETGIVEVLSRGTATWDELKYTVTTGAAERRLFGGAIDRLQEGGRVRAVGCLWGCVHRGDCRFEAVTS